jgi:hypothetical protein
LNIVPFVFFHLMFILITCLFIDFGIVKLLVV